METIKYFFLNFNYVPVLAGLSAFILSTSFYLYPVIINVSRQKGLMDEPDNRKMHKNVTPTLGGLGVFIAFSLCIIFYASVTDLVPSDLLKLLGLLGSAIILVFLGVKDDLLSMSPKKKLLGQLLAVINVVVLTDVRIISFDGLLGIGELPYFVSILFTVFVFILIINALNLIDGIDGLAGLISIISSLIFGILFFVREYYLMTLIASILIGSILGFLRYNLSSDKKIFMGDCGSMLAGFLLAYQGISLLALNSSVATANLLSNAPVLFLAILSYPLFDLLRVFAVRIKLGKSPFDADANHIHHRLLKLGLDHKEATLILSVLSMLVIGTSFLFNNLDIHMHLIITLLIGVLVYMAPFLKVFESTINSDAKDLSISMKGEVNPLPGISSDSVIFSKFKHNLSQKIDDSEIVFIENEVEQKVNGDFGTIVQNRKENLQRIKKKHRVIKPIQVKGTVEKEL